MRSVWKRPFIKRDPREPKNDFPTPSLTLVCWSRLFVGHAGQSRRGVSKSALFFPLAPWSHRMYTHGHEISRSLSTYAAKERWEVR